MQSDVFSADQLFEFQRRIEESLRAKGIDPSILSDFGVNTVAPRRRLPPNKNGAGNAKSEAGKAHSQRNGGAANGGGKKGQPKVNLTILQ